MAPACPGVSLIILATDIDEAMLKRAREGCFEEHSLHDLPPHLVASAFDRSTDRFCVRPEHREGITFLFQDLRSEMPSEDFDLILNRYVAFTYFALPLQRQILRTRDCGQASLRSDAIANPASKEHRAVQVSPERGARLRGSRLGSARTGLALAWLVSWPE